ncbi:MAG: carboxypeptidase regulatory-like domain-containing protein [Candidatus Thermoplasmatota archaeon]|nr:carboxypeptidase regulatory-like domain-containing protein [Candidatus Thermoplasmatota archaeon]MBU4592268.1 carboxypeptidase regulatory-like domain-containing protein [Candidatus Thermoplasmatota archaeon]
MKWLKKNSSDNEQISIVESQPEPEHISEQAPQEIYAPAPETLEQPVIAEAEPMQVQTPNQSGRRRAGRTTDEVKNGNKKSRLNIQAFKNSWIGHHWKTFAILFAIFCIAFFARAYYGVGPATEDGYLLSGGSDSYYHHYVASVGSDTGDFHFWEPMLNYPVGTRNPRPPLYDWSLTLTGMALSPFFDGDVYSSTMYFFIFSTAFWGALTIFPTYFLGKEAFGKKTGIFAAFLLAVLPGHVQRSVLTNADHDAITLFFMVLAFYFFLKALKTLSHQEWIKNWEKPREVLKGLQEFVRHNPLSILYGVLAGLSIAGVALIWQGFAYAIVLIAVYFLVQILLNRFRNTDSFGVFVIFFVTIGTGLLLAFPYYYLSLQIPSWFDTPAYLFLGLSVFAVILMATRKYPWFLVFTSIIAVSLLATIFLKLLAPSVLDSIVNALLSGGGYFINNKQYQTIAEAQAPPFSNLALSFGIFTFWLSFIGVAWAAIQLPKTWKADFTFILLWAGTSIYMAVTAARFMFNAAPAFAITAGWVLAIIIGKLNLKKYISELKRASKPHMTYNFKMGIFASLTVLIILAVVLTTVSGIAYPVFVVGLTILCGIYMLNLIAETNPNRLYNLLTIMIPASCVIFYLVAESYTNWVITDATHLFILALSLFAYVALFFQVRRTSFLFTTGIIFLALCIVVPNVWAGLDAGIPYETKSDYDKEIYDSMPIFMQPSDYDVINGTNWYLGGFGYSLPLNSRYWPAAYDWLGTQDEDIYPDYNKPAFLSWWDYGFEVVNEGKHPTVADNFLGGHQLAGNFIMSQSEEDAIALLCVRLLEGNWNHGWGQSNFFDPEVVTVLENHGINMGALNNIFENPSQYTDIILANPDIYGPRDDIIQNANALYIASRVLITQTLDIDGIVSLYDDICSVTGNSIRYFGIDSRLFPFSADNTGIFYAPAKLSDHRISDVANQPYDFWEIKAIGEFGGEYELDSIPPDVKLDPYNPYQIVYKDMFYNSMLYKAFIGYSGDDIGQPGAGIPGLSETLSSNQIMPGWNLTHFKLVHRTAYWNPYPANEIQNHTDAWTAMNYWDAYEKQQAGEGISDLSDRSSIYQGAMMLKYYHGAIVSGKVMLEDGTPLSGVSVTVMDDFGIPHQRVTTDSDGQYSIIAPPGDINVVASTGSIDPLTLIGTTVNVTSMYIEDYQAMRTDEDRNFDGTPDYMIDQNLIVGSSGVSGSVYWDIDSDGAITDDVDEIVNNAQISLSNSEITFDTMAYTDDSGNYNLDIIPPGSYTVLISYANRTIGTHSFSVSTGETTTQNIPINVIALKGTVKFSDNYFASGARVRVWDSKENLEFITYTDGNGNFSFANVLYGNFFIQADIDVYASTPQMIEVIPDMNNTIDLVVYDSFTLTGSVTLNGVPVPYSTIKIAGPSNTLILSDFKGVYSAKLNDGEYIYYVSHIKNNVIYSAIGRIYVEDDSVFDIQLQLGCMVSGTITDGYGRRAPDTQVVFDSLGTSIYVSAISDKMGEYTIILPQGGYHIQVSSLDYGTYYSLQYLTLQIINLNISTRIGTIVSGEIFWDVNHDGAKTIYEELNAAQIMFKEPNGNYALAITDSNGTFFIIVPPATSYQVTVSKSGFFSVDLGVHTATTLSGGIVQSLEPIMIPITGKVYLADEVLVNQNIILDFTSEMSGLPSKQFQIGRDGVYSGQITPGVYSISFTHNISLDDDTNVYQIEREMFFDTGLYDGNIIDLDIVSVQRSKVSISITNPDFTGANITFKQGPESRNLDMKTNFETYYLQPGDYVLSAVHPLNDTIMVDMQDISVVEGLNEYNISLKNGISHSGSLIYDNQPISLRQITFKDVSSNGTISVNTDESGMYDIFLVPNVKYDILVDFVAYEEVPYLQAYRYYSDNLTINAATASTGNVINLQRDVYTSNITGSVSRNGLSAPNTEITFTSHLGNYTVVSNADGEFSLELIPTEYTIYAHQYSSHYVGMFKTIIDIESSSTFALNLVQGYRVYGTAYYERNMNAVTQLEFTTPDGSIMNSITTDESGYYELWLPMSTYTVTGELMSTKNEIDVTYSLNMDIDLFSDAQINLPLTLDEDRIVFVSFETAQLKLVKPDTTVNYTFEVENMGNIQDTYGISATGGGTDWTTLIVTPEVTVNPGVNNKAKVTISIYVPHNAVTDQNKVTLTAISQKNTSVRHSNVMNLLILQNHEFVIQPSATSPIYDQGSLELEFTILNKGNGADKFTIYIGNNEDLSKNGWRAELGEVQTSDLLMDGKKLVNVSVSSDGTTNIPLYLYPISDNPSRQATVLIIGYSQIDGTAIASNNILVKYPELQLSGDNLVTTGIGITEVQSGDQLMNAGIMAISVASALLLFYYARKKRWVR